MQGAGAAGPPWCPGRLGHASPPDRRPGRPGPGSGGGRRLAGRAGLQPAPGHRQHPAGPAALPRLHRLAGVEPPAVGAGGPPLQDIGILNSTLQIILWT